MPTFLSSVAVLAIVAGTAAGVQPDPAPGSSPSDPRSEQAPPTELTETRAKPVVSLTFSGSYTAQADLDTGPGDVTVTTAAAKLEVTLPIEPRRSVTLSLQTQESWYDFNGATGLEAGGGDPFSEINQTDLSLFYTAPVNDDTGYFVLARVGFAAEAGAELGDSIIYGGGLGFTVRASDTFTWGLGVAVFSQLEDDVLIIPLPQIRWGISDRWTLATQGPGVQLSYKASDLLSYGLAAEFVSDTFRLDDTGPLPSFVATDRRFPVSFFADYAPSDSISLRGAVGAALGANFEILDASGNTIIDDDADPSVYASLSARIKF